MSKREEEYRAAERLFGAMSGVDEKLLERSEKKQKVVPFRRYGGICHSSRLFVSRNHLILHCTGCIRRLIPH